MASSPAVSLVPPLTQSDALAVADFVERLRTTLGDRLAEVRLFGSKARGDAGPESDIDILVVVACEDRWPAAKAVSDVALDVNIKYEVLISPIVVTAGMVRDPVWRRSDLLRDAYAEGFPL